MRRYPGRCGRRHTPARPPLAHSRVCRAGRPPSCAARHPPACVAVSTPAAAGGRRRRSSSSGSIRAAAYPAVGPAPHPTPCQHNVQISGSTPWRGTMSSVRRNCGAGARVGRPPGAQKVGRGSEGGGEREGGEREAPPGQLPQQPDPPRLRPVGVPARPPTSRSPNTSQRHRPGGHAVGRACRRAACAKQIGCRWALNPKR